MSFKDNSTEDFTVETKFDLEFEKEQPPELEVRFVQIASGWNHILCLGEDGLVYATGLNINGQCGIGHKNKVTRLTPVKLPKKLREQGVGNIACGDVFSVITSCKKVFKFFVTNTVISMWTSICDGKISRIKFGPSSTDIFARAWSEFCSLSSLWTKKSFYYR